MHVTEARSNDKLTAVARGTADVFANTDGVQRGEGSIHPFSGAEKMGDKKDVYNGRSRNHGQSVRRGGLDDSDVNPPMNAYRQGGRSNYIYDDGCAQLLKQLPDKNTIELMMIATLLLP